MIPEHPKGSMTVQRMSGLMQVNDDGVRRWWGGLPAIALQMAEMGLQPSQAGDEYYALVDGKAAIVCPVPGGQFFMWLHPHEWRWTPLRNRRPVAPCSAN